MSHITPKSPVFFQNSSIENGHLAFPIFSPSSEHPISLFWLVPNPNLVGESHDKSPLLSIISQISTFLTLNPTKKSPHLRTSYKHLWFLPTKNLHPWRMTAPRCVHQEDPQMRWLSLRQNSLLRQPVAAWRFRRNEVLMLLQAPEMEWVGGWVGWNGLFQWKDLGFSLFFGVVRVVIIVEIVVRCIGVRHTCSCCSRSLLPLNSMECAKTLVAVQIVKLWDPVTTGFDHCLVPGTKPFYGAQLWSITTCVLGESAQELPNKCAIDLPEGLDSHARSGPSHDYIWAIRNSLDIQIEKNSWASFFHSQRIRKRQVVCSLSVHFFGIPILDIYVRQKTGGTLYYSTKTGCWWLDTCIAFALHDTTRHDMTIHDVHVTCIWYVYIIYTYL